MRSIGIDCRFASALAGLGTFTRELTSALLKADTVDHFVLFVSSKEEDWLRQFHDHPHVKIQAVGIPPYSFAEQIRLPLLLKKSGIDLLFVPHFNVPLFCPVPFVCTVHDLILHHYPNQAPLLKRLAYRAVLAVALHRSKRVVTVSKATKQDILRRYRIGANKIVTVYPGISSYFGTATDATRDEAVQMHGIRHPFFLYVGNCKEHKNVQTLVDAFEVSHLAGTHELLLASSGSECERIVLKPGVRFIGPVEQRLLPSLYALSAGFVTATKLEGFCLPVVEAMACGCPVAASNVDPIPEVTGGHAFLIAPEADAIAGAMKALASGHTLASPEHLEKAREWTKRFTWELAAKELRGILNAA